MAQSLAILLVHLVFSTKNRERVLSDAIRDDLHAYLGGIIVHNGGQLLRAGSVEDHIHLLLTLSRTATPARMVQDIKTGSSKWVKGKGAEFAEFSWQGGYGMFSVSASNEAELKAYIANQAEHHKVVTFQEEYRRLLQKHGI